MEEFETTRRRQVDVHYMNAGIPRTIEENLEGYYYLEHEDLPLEEVLQDQEILYRSFQTNTENDTTEAYESSHTSPNTDQSDSEIVQKEGEYSQTNDVAAQIALDEALARTMQEMENHEFAGTSITETAGTTAETTSSASSPIIGESSSIDTTVVSREDDIDPDNMTYEELEALGEAIGTHSRGLSDELISYLPTFKYKTGMFSKTDKHECVICLMAYKKRDIVMTLPCQHPFHSDCISQWLQHNKACPICYEEVFGS
ncbi:E3 ubiquitin ligase BIG BROTHER-related-like [Magnolia sinica]|uniref:E3 ubiquitin ligase BIG BROTHER-related-like n=1 Tax=Magnolia sinica TaxID=86752 RepID=UPI0026583DD4|nr:E3 ubiquitin ligase BIG BROTHER-related-like [Magnolia sinica]